jgi:secondary thiamine-phosphate synthase enzyme
MIKELEIKTSRRNEMEDITDRIQALISESKIASGVCVIYCPHTTAGVTINENADPSVKRDLLEFFEKNIPRSADYHHTEGNADAHIKASLIGSSKSILFDKGKLLLGTWQGIFFCEFDGPRARRLWLKLIQG